MKIRWNERYKYPRSSRSLVMGQRYYEIDNNPFLSKLPSVTTVIAQTQSEEKKASLARWRQNVGEKEADSIMNDASKRGTAMHSYLEHYLISLKTGLKREDLTDIGVQGKKMAMEIIKYGFEDLNEIWGCEATMYYPGKYAGTTDVCGRYMGEDSIIDFKQTNKPKREEWIDDYFVQLAAYAIAHNKVYDTKINQGVILMCSKDGMYQRFTVSGQRFMDFKDKWQRRLEQYYGDKDNGDKADQ